MVHLKIIAGFIVTTGLCLAHRLQICLGDNWISSLALAVTSLKSSTLQTFWLKETMSLSPRSAHCSPRHYVCFPLTALAGTVVPEFKYYTIISILVFAGLTLCKLLVLMMQCKGWGTEIGHKGLMSASYHGFNIN